MVISFTRLALNLRNPEIRAENYFINGKLGTWEFPSFAVSTCDV